MNMKTYSYAKIYTNVHNRDYSECNPSIYLQINEETKSSINTMAYYLPIKSNEIRGDLSKWWMRKLQAVVQPTQTKNKQRYMLKINFVRTQKPVKKLQQTNKHLTKSLT